MLAIDSRDIQCRPENNIETTPNKAYVSYTRESQSTTIRDSAGNKLLSTEISPDEAHTLGLDYVQNEAYSHTVIETKENLSYSVELPKNTTICTVCGEENPDT